MTKSLVSSFSSGSVMLKKQQQQQQQPSTANPNLQNMLYGQQLPPQQQKRGLDPGSIENGDTPNKNGSLKGNNKHEVPAPGQQVQQQQQQQQQLTSTAARRIQQHHKTGSPQAQSPNAQARTHQRSSADRDVLSGKVDSGN